jgi:hypothetical protein
MERCVVKAKESRTCVVPEDSDNKNSHVLTNKAIGGYQDPDVCCMSYDVFPGTKEMEKLLQQGTILLGSEA